MGKGYTEVVLLGSSFDHHLGRLLVEALEGEKYKVVTLAQPERPGGQLSRYLFMVWNLEDLDREDALQQADILNELDCNLFLLCPELDQTVLLLLERLKSVIGLSVAPGSAEDIRVSLQVAAEVHRHLNRLRTALQLERESFQNRLLVEKGKRKLMKERNWPEEKAMKYLQERSRNNNRKLHQVARDLLAGKDDSGGGGGE